MSVIPVIQEEPGGSKFKDSLENLLRLFQDKIKNRLGPGGVAFVSRAPV
jgi:hypothetical protein